MFISICVTMLKHLHLGPVLNIHTFIINTLIYKVYSYNILTHIRFTTNTLIFIYEHNYSQIFFKYVLEKFWKAPETAINFYTQVHILSTCPFVKVFAVCVFMAGCVYFVIFVCVLKFDKQLSLFVNDTIWEVFNH